MAALGERQVGGGGEAFLEMVFGERLQSPHADLVVEHGVRRAGGFHGGDDGGCEGDHILLTELVFKEIPERGARHAIGIRGDRADGLVAQLGIHLVHLILERPAENGGGELAVGELYGILPANRPVWLRGGNQSLEDAFQGGLGGAAHVADGLGGLESNPAIRMRELFHQYRQGFGGVEQTQCFAGTLDLVRVAAIGEFDELGNHGFAFRPFRQFIRRPTADDGRPVVECHDQFLRGHFPAIQIEAPGRDDTRGLFLVEPAGWVGIAAGDNQLAQGQGVGEDIRGGRAQVVVAALSEVGVVIRFPRAVLLAAVVGERAVRTPHEIEVP